MSAFIPNTLAAVFRNGTVPDGEDDWGYPDPVAHPTVDQADARDLPALITDAGQRTRQNAEGTAVVVHLYRLRLRPGDPGFPLTEQDRVLDQRAGTYYEIDAVPLPTSIVQAGDVRLTLRRVS